MKYLFTLLFCLSLVFTNTFAQKWVSTEVDYKNALIEEFTGLHCGYCPDGHRMANEIANANPGKVFLVNIHSGSFAVPSPGQPDLHIDDGWRLDTLAKAYTIGYPAGSVNRSTTPWAMSRDLWSNAVNSIITQLSPVNIAVKSSVDFTTRKLITEVELYYTVGSSKKTNYLTVVLTQSNIQGYQSDYGNYNPMNWTIDGLYRHNHVLRQVISSGGVMGEVVDTTTKGHYEYRKYETDLPDQINLINIALYNLDVIAFVSETQNNIYTVSGTPVSYDPSLFVDLSVKKLMPDKQPYILSSINPKIEVTNNSAIDVTSFDISLLLNSQIYTRSYQGKLAKGEKAVIDWGDMTFSPYLGYKILFEGFKNINNNKTIADMDYTNDSYTFFGYGLLPKAFTTYRASFESTTIPPNTIFEQDENSSFTIQYTSTAPLGAKNSIGAVRFPIHEAWNVAGKTGSISFGEADLSKLTKPQLLYYYAYSDDNYGGTPPVIKVIVSEDKGLTWTELNSLTAVQTGAPSTHGNWYIPKSSEYIKVGVDLDKLQTKNVILKVTVTPGSGGNDLWLDEISVDEWTDVRDPELAGNDILYPNPATSNIQFTDIKLIGQIYSIYSVNGQLMSCGLNESNKIDIQSFQAGTYHIHIGDKIYKFMK